MLVTVILKVENVLTLPSTALLVVLELPVCCREEGIGVGDEEEEDETSSGEAVVISMVGSSSRSTTCLRRRVCTSVDTADFSKTLAPTDRNHKTVSNSVSS